MTRLRVACLQINATDDWKDNLRRSLEWAYRSLKHRVHWITLPENFLYRGTPKAFSSFAYPAMRLAVAEFKHFAKSRNVACLLGSVVEPCPGKGRKFFNTSILINEQGMIKAVYRKIHLFDAFLPSVQVRETDHFEHGRSAVAGKAWGVSAGLSICYDLRFPELYRSLAKKGARILFVPSNFTYATGKDHWELLLRSRAVENQCFVVAPAQSGANKISGLKSYGTSLIIDPWGKVLAKASCRGEGIVTAELDFSMQERLRRQFPVLESMKHGFK